MTAAQDAPKFFATAAAFRRWLAKHAASERVLIVGFHKVDSGLPSMTWPESVDEALCYGWIDGVRKRVDAQSYQIRFTPRRPSSIWSAINIAKAEALRTAGKMTAAGERAFAHRTDKKSVVYAYEQDSEAALSPAERGAFRKAKGSWTYLRSCPPSYRRLVLHWIVSAKKSETRAKRLQRVIEACAAHKRL
ncbi:MAG: YdeI/OmpD-associated family protein [Gemmatimonadota bacterium]|nr:YdeI/OmpD-associated family protein [Gemmatimonadota bacterium]